MKGLTDRNNTPISLLGDFEFNRVITEMQIDSFLIDTMKEERKTLDLIF